LPMALTLIKPEIDDWEPGEHNGTFRGHNPAYVPGTKALRTFWADDELEKNGAARSEQQHARLELITSLAEGSQVRGRGRRSGGAFRDLDAADEVAAAGFGRGLMIETSGSCDEVIKVMAALTTTEEQLAEGLDALEDAAREVLGARAREGATVSA